MNSLSRWLVLPVGSLLGLAAVAGSASAWPHCCKSTTYYQPAVVAACPTTCCAPPVASAVVPVTVTTRRYGLFGLRQRTTVSYGAPVPVVAPAPVLAAPAPIIAPPASAYLPGVVTPGPRPMIIPGP